MTKQSTSEDASKAADLKMAESPKEEQKGEKETQPPKIAESAPTTEVMKERGGSHEKKVAEVKKKQKKSSCWKKMKSECRKLEEEDQFWSMCCGFACFSACLVCCTQCGECCDSCMHD